jgi:rhodanese-related sulfurtransferase
MMAGTTSTVQWHELDDEMAHGATLVDVRTEKENAAGAIPGSICIPVDDLRERIPELTGKRVIVHCQVGQRGHTATQILRSHGINVANLDGGWLTWSAGQRALGRSV